MYIYIYIYRLIIEHWTRFGLKPDLGGNLAARSGHCEKIIPKSDFGDNLAARIGHCATFVHRSDLSDNFAARIGLNLIGGKDNRENRISPIIFSVVKAYSRFPEND